MQYLPILVLALIVVLTSSYFISRASYKRIRKAGNEYALGLSILIFLVSAAIIGFVCVELIINNIRIER